jgi:Disulfide bond formation protein DsbB
VTDTADTFFTILTVLANVAVVVFVLLGLGALASASLRGVARRLVDAVGPSALPLAFVVAATATAGSLYYSEIAEYTPCVLCWYQRICMYPLVVVLGVGWVRRESATWLYALPFLVAGVPVSTYHLLVERYPSLGSGLSCSIDAPCTVPYFETLGFVTLAWMCLSGFLLIGTLLAVDRAWARSPVTLEVP